MITFCNSYVLWLLRCVHLRLGTVTFWDVNVVWCYVLSQYHSWQTHLPVSTAVTLYFNRLCHVRYSTPWHLTGYWKDLCRERRRDTEQIGSLSVRASDSFLKDTQVWISFLNSVQNSCRVLSIAVHIPEYSFLFLLYVYYFTPYCLGHNLFILKKLAI
jgi:hypothetical protein